MRAGKWFVAMAVLLVATQAPLSAGPSTYARISYVDGGFYMQRAQNYDTGEVGVNTPVGDGDSLWTEGGSRLEIEFGAGNYVRLDENSRIDVRSAGATGGLVLQGGSLYVELRSSEQFQIDSPFATVYPMQVGVYRVDMGRSGGLLVSVYDGLAEVTNAAGSIMVRAGMQTQVYSGRLPTQPVPFQMARRDVFDDFQNNRAGSVAYGYDTPGSEYLPEDLSYYGGELDRYGSWRYVSPYGYVWAPIGVGVDWRPYRYGYWDWLNANSCWGWVSYEPWGWAPYHYGRWDFAMGIGWFWIPGTIWGPAWVSWGGWGDWLGWCPLNYYDRPVVIVNNYYGNWWGDNWISNPDYRSWTFIPKEHIGGRDIARVAVGDNEIRSINRITVSKDPLRIAPKEGITRSAIKGSSTIAERNIGSGGNIIRTETDGGKVGFGGSGSGKIGQPGPKPGSTIIRETGGDGREVIHSGPTETRDGGKGGSVIRTGDDPGGPGRVTYGGSGSGSTERPAPKPGSTVVPRETGRDGGNVIYSPPNKGRDDGNKGGNTFSTGDKNRGGVVYSPPSPGRNDAPGGNVVRPGDNNRGGGNVIYVPPRKDQESGTISRDPSTDRGSSVQYYNSRSGGSGGNETSIVRHPEERNFYEPPASTVERQPRPSETNGSLWGKVYDQFRSSSGSGDRSDHSGGSSVQPRSGGSDSGRSGGSGGGYQPRPSPSPSPRPSPPPPASKGGSGGGNVVKKH
ncbi:MAG: FecR family protein [Acidobacteriota bacterium]